MEKILKSKYYTLIVSFIILVFWLLCFFQYSKENHLASKYLSTIESIELTAIGLICAFLLIRYADLFYVVPWIAYTPFVFTHPFDTAHIPYSLFIAIGFLFIGLIVHIIRFKSKIRFGSFFLGLALLAIALALGGILTKASYIKEQIIFIIPASIALLFIYMLFASNVDVNFRIVAHLINNLGVLLCFQVVVSIIYSVDPLSFIIQKNIGVGWGISNNIAIMLLMTFPCSTYLAITSKKAKTILYVFAGYAQTSIIIATYSRGAILALLGGGLAIIIFAIIIAFKRDKKMLIYYASSIAFFMILTIIIMVIFANTNNDRLIPYANGFKENISKLNLDSLNGRMPIYKHYFEEFKQNLVFGKGLYSPYYDNELTGNYQWGHSTIIHTMYTMGIVGLIALGFHMAQKYLNLLIKPNLEKIIVVFSFLISGLYGLVDVSYYFINYMVVLIMYLVCIERTIKLSFNVI